jgi:Viral BACON domain
VTPVRTSISVLTSLVVLGCVCAAKAQTVSVTPQALSFVYQIGGSNPGAQNIYLSAGIPTTFAVTVSGAPWLSVSPTTGTTPATLVATVTPPAGATPGTLNGSIIIGPPASADNLMIVVSVTLQVLAPSQGNLVATPSSLYFTYGIGGPAAPPQTISVTSAAGPETFNVTTSATWLAAFQSSFATPSSVQVFINPVGLSPGLYGGSVSIAPAYGGAALQQVNVSLQVFRPGTLSATPNILSFTSQVGGTTTPQTLNIVSSTGGAVPFSITSTTNNGGNWLTYSTTTGTTPANIAVAASPGAMAPGTYGATITITPTTQGINPTQVPVTLTIAGSSQLVVSPTNLTFSYQGGGPLPGSQYVSVTSTNTPISYNITTVGPSWVTTSTGSGTTPSGFGVVVTPPSSTPSGTYAVNIVVTPINGGGPPVTIAVSISVTPPNYLTLGRTSAAFDYTTGGANPAPVIVPVTSSGARLPFTSVPVTSGPNNWLSVFQSSQYTPADITIGVNPQNLSAGTYAGTVVVNADGAVNGQQSIAVTLIVTQSASFVAAPFGLVFSYQIGTNAPGAQSFVVSSQSSMTAFSVTTTTGSGGNWLLAAGSGPTPATVAAAVNTTGLSPGTYSGQIQITSSDPSVGNLQLPVVLNVSPGPVFQPAANQVSFQYETGGAAPAAQTVAINANNGGSIVYYPTTQTADGGSWLTVTPDLAVTPSSLTIAVNPTGLNPGFYFGLIGVNDAAGSVPTSFVPVTLQVANGPILGVSAQPLFFSTQVGIGPINSQPITVNSVGPPSQFQVTTYGGSWLTASPMSGTTNGVINVTAAPGGLAAGYYLGTVSIAIPGVPNSQQYVPVTFVVSPF